MPEVTSEEIETAPEANLAEQLDPTDGRQELGVLARVLSVPLAPVVVGWDATKAFFTQLLPHLSRRVLAAVRTVARAVIAFAGRILRPVQAARRSLGRALHRLGQAIGTGFRRMAQLVRRSASLTVDVVQRFVIGPLAAAAKRAAPLRSTWRRTTW